ncbi:ABC-2 type transport system permease protein [Oikeobacillus pervagus]|uniref:ABC-2 type transport system permease protein n=1 Tax=Oikeobacillus pervagus TaxID=1325931 RepID=A0AAJ1T3V5_9BACI|nr:ABC transporter permease [Oikeobacillus pervagus]MDQ0214746.1 ABC-2 type transport system permease protein [Oikeobacillus pervagus]
MNNFWIILSHSYMNKFKSKAFIITTLLVAAGILLLSNIEKIISVFDDETGDQIAVIDESGTLFESYKQHVKTISKDIQLSKVTKSEEELKKEIEKDTYEGYLILSLGEDHLPKGVYKAQTVSNSSIADDLQLALQGFKSNVAATQLNLNAEQLQTLNGPASFEKIALEEGAKTEEELAQAQILVYVLLFFIYFAVIMYANMIATEVAIEKSSRVMEILISSVSPVKQMFAKILGVGLLGLTQMLIWIAIGYFMMKQQADSSILKEVIGLDQTPVSTIVYALVFFALGYFLYATLAAFLGSLVSRLEDAQQMVMPMTFLIMIGFFIAMFGLNNPEAPFVTISSYIPFFTPMIMFMRVGMVNIPTWEALLGIGILVVSIIILAIIGARVYRGGVLMYGNSNSFKDIKKALQLTKKNS